MSFRSQHVLSGNRMFTILLLVCVWVDKEAAKQRARNAKMASDSWTMRAEPPAQRMEAAGPKGQWLKTWLKPTLALGQWVLSL